MPPFSGPAETLPSASRVHVLGAGPVGLAVTALLQSSGRFAVNLYEKRNEYTRTRMVQLAPYLVADSVASYSADNIDGESIGAIFDPAELEEGLAFRRSIPADLMGLLRQWTVGFVPLNDIERALSDLIDTRPHPVTRTPGAVSAPELAAMHEPGDVVIDCTGTRSVLRDFALDATASPGGRFADDPPSLEWICFHVLAEYARHAGHLDIAVELTGPG